MDAALSHLASGALVAVLLPRVDSESLAPDTGLLEARATDALLRPPGWSVLRRPGDPDSAPSPASPTRPPLDFGDLSEKLYYVLTRVPELMDAGDVADALRAAFSPAAIAAMVAVLAAWAASHFFGVGFAVDMVLLAVGFALVGWGIFRALDLLLDALKVVRSC